MVQRPIMPYLPTLSKDDFNTGNIQSKGRVLGSSIGTIIGTGIGLAFPPALVLSPVLSALGGALGGLAGSAKDKEIAQNLHKKYTDYNDSIRRFNRSTERYVTPETVKFMDSIPDTYVPVRMGTKSTAPLNIDLTTKESKGLNAAIASLYGVSQIAKNLNPFSKVKNTEIPDISIQPDIEAPKFKIPETVPKIIPEYNFQGMVGPSPFSPIKNPIFAKFYKPPVTKTDLITNPLTYPNVINYNVEDLNKYINYLKSII